jgi:membrane peptidoglycan carboxypeptidase
MVWPGWKSHGGSTLATQLEKARHSPGGRTSSGLDKIRQMATASLRAYREGPITETARRRTLVEYLNGVPLAALPGYGEVHGLGDGLWAWYGADFALTNQLLSQLPAAGDGAKQIASPEATIAYRQVLSLLLAQRRPAYYLVEDPSALEGLTDRYLQMLDAAGMLPPGLAASAPVERRLMAPARGRSPLTERKADLAVRSRVAQLLDVDRLYDLDRYDLTVNTTLDAETQRAVTRALLRLSDGENARRAGVAPLLGGDPAGVLYSFTVYERTPSANAVRVQVDSEDQPLDLNDGAKLELGSTAKLRTLVTYLELMAELHDRYAALAPAEAARLRDQAPDALSRFALDYLATAKEPTLDGLLEAAMTRRYSASPWEGFFTGGGLHHFRNFDPADNERRPTVRQGFDRSVNLVFIRLMRDLVEHYRARLPAVEAGILDDPDQPLRRAYLERFAAREGAEYLRRYYRAYGGLTPDRALEALVAGWKPTAKRLTAIYRSARPGAPFEELDRFVRAHLPHPSALDERTLRTLYEQLSPQRVSLADRAYLGRVQPLELWLLEYLSRHPEASFADVLEASADVRQEVYAWIYRPGHQSAQDRRIRTLLEAEAFVDLHRAWRQVGYPFDSLVPSYATAIGSSADRPSALAELLGILVNGGVRSSTERLSRLHFGAGTPFETVLERVPRPSQRVLHAEVAAVVQRELYGVVRTGTASRAPKTIALADGRTLEVGGKTGTGDNRIKRAGAKATRQSVMSRTASFVFTLGDRFYGTVVVYVPGEAAADYHFTSTAAIQVFKYLLPALQPLFDGTPLESEWTLFGGAASAPDEVAGGGGTASMP